MKKSPVSEQVIAGNIRFLWSRIQMRGDWRFRQNWDNFSLQSQKQKLSEPAFICWSVPDIAIKLSFAQDKTWRFWISESPFEYHL